MNYSKALIFLIITAFTNGYVPEDEVKNLPGINFDMTYKHYSGYLNGGENKHMHYWFFESQNDPVNDPLVLWLNGGPGCSSLMGLLTENGPILINDDGETLRENPYSWNKITNVLYLESPACVGFSYNSQNHAFCATGDDHVAESNYLALKDFFEKYPEFRSNEFIITGESYAGIYIPTLAKVILENQDSFSINITAYAIGNGMSSYDYNQNSLISFAYYHGLLGHHLWDRLTTSCCENGNCNFSSTDAACQLNVYEATLIIYSGKLNYYGLYNYCPKPNANTEYYMDMDNAFRNFKKPEIKIDERQVRNDPPCTDSSASNRYLNSPAVKTALHIPDGIPDWGMCNDLVNVMYKRDYSDMSEHHLYLHGKLRALIYNGDTDMACNYLGWEWFSEDLGLEETEKYRMWYDGNQVAGFVKSFGSYTIMTVLGAGHMVPTDRPSACFTMFNNFIKNTPY